MPHVRARAGQPVQIKLFATEKRNLRNTLEVVDTIAKMVPGAVSKELHGGLAGLVNRFALEPVATPEDTRDDSGE